MRSRWWLRARRDKTGWQAHHVLHNRRPQECSARRTAELPRNRAAPLAPAAQPPAAREVVNVREQGHRRRDHDEAVKMVNFSRTKKPAKCDLNKNPRESLVPGSWSPREETECPLR